MSMSSFRKGGRSAGVSGFIGVLVSTEKQEWPTYLREYRYHCVPESACVVCGKVVTRDSASKGVSKERQRCRVVRIVLFPTDGLWPFEWIYKHNKHEKSLGFYSCALNTPLIKLVHASTMMFETCISAGVAGMNGESIAMSRHWPMTNLMSDP